MESLRIYNCPPQVRRIRIPSYSPPSIAYCSLFLLSRLKSRYHATSCAFDHRLFLTSYMLSLKVICDNTYSNKVSASYNKNPPRDHN